MDRINTNIRGLILLVLVILSAAQVQGQFYSGARQEFGKNRVQYQDFLWSYYKWDSYEVYFYAGGRDLAEYVSYSAQKHLQEVQKEFDFNLSDPLQFIVYTSQTDYRQSNVGITGDELYNIGGVTRIVGTKVFLYYEGDHASLDRQIRSGITRVVLQQLMYGGNWRDVVKNSTLLSLPNWFSEGLISHASGPMDPNVYSRVKDGASSGRFRKLNRLEGEDATVAGHAIWSYVSEVYGSAVIPNILYMTRISRNAESGFLYVLGVSLRTLINDCMNFYEQKAKTEDASLYALRHEKIPLKTKHNRSYSQFRADPQGRKVAYVSNELGQYRVWMYDLAEEKRKLLHKGEHKLNRIIDKSYPVLAWHPSGKALSWVIEKKGELWLNTYTLDDNKRSAREIFTLDKVLDLQYSNDGTRLVFSGVREGQTDIFIFYVLGGRLEQLTNDQYDDLNPRFVNQDNSLVFASNRYDDTLRVRQAIEYVTNKTDIFMMDLRSQGNTLQRLTNTPDINEIQPFQYDSVNYVFLSDEGLAWNQSIVRLDSSISHVDTTVHYRKYTVKNKLTDLRRSIIQHDVLSRNGRIAFLSYNDGGYEMLFDKILDEPQVKIGAEGTTTEAIQTANVELSKIKGSTAIIKVDPRSDDSEGEPVNINDYVFLDDKKPVMTPADQSIIVDPLAKSGTSGSDKPARSNELTFPEQRIYAVNFAADKVLTQVDNSFSDQFYQVFDGGNGNLNPGLSIENQLGVSDLFEDYRITGGFRPALDLNNFDFEFAYENLKNRVDHRFSGLIQTNRTFLDFFVIKTNTSQFKWRAKYPFSEVASLRGSFLYRYDRSVAQSIDLTSLALANSNDHHVGLKVEYVFDNTIPKGLNLYTGWRYKLFGEYYQHPTEGNSDMTVLGFDFRHSQQVHRDIIWVNRIAGSQSLGSRKVAFFLGGVDNWLFPKYDNSIPIDFTQNYWWQTMGTPMRGFYYNARNGTSFAVANSELRIPVFKYLLNKPIRSDLINNFQIIGFGDAGSAWTGRDPYSTDNSFNTITIPSNPLTITLKNQRDPIVASYGFGLRTRLLGYFVRADWAWGIDDRQRLPGEFFFSLSLDI